MNNYPLRQTVDLQTHGKFPLKLLIEYEYNSAYFYVEYAGEKIGLIQDNIGTAQSLYNNILKVLKLGVSDQ